MTSRTPDPVQDRVIRSEPSARLVVESGPGCGKTDVACARVAYLIEQGIPGSQIVLLSFTRTAVRELRNRIRQVAKKTADVGDADVRTIDSFAWRIRTGGTEVRRTSLTGGYEDSIREAKAALEKHDAIIEEYLAQLRHVLIDESQDLVGERAAFVLSLMNRLGPECGWTVFLDPAQAIYEWSETGSAQRPSVSFTLEAARLVKGEQAEKVVLSKLYRASDPKLVSLLEKSRPIALKGGKDAVERIRRIAFDHSDSDATPLNQRAFSKLVRDADPDTLFLFRTRVEAFEASRWLAKETIPHRLRFGGLPHVLPAWIGATLGEMDRKDFSEQQFSDAWSTTAKDLPLLLAGWDSERAWRVLRRLGWDRASKRILLSRVADRLSQSSLPDDLAAKEVGEAGPIIGTIHGSKGREAPVVYACIAAESSCREDRDTEEEARVIYVALTRAKRRCAVRQSEGLGFATTPSGRIWRQEGYVIRFECGRLGDVDAKGALLASVDPQTQQKLLRQWNGQAVDLRGQKTPDAGREGRPWRHLLFTEKGKTQEIMDKAVASLSQRWTDEVHKQIFLKAGWRSTPALLYDFRWLGVGTVGFGDHDSSLIPYPWRTSRLWLSPVVVSWACAFKPRSR